MSQCSFINYKQIIQQQQEQLATMQVQLQMLLAVQEARAVGPRHSLEVNTEVEKPQAFDRTTEKISGFLTACKLFIGIRMREDAVEEQIQ